MEHDAAARTRHLLFVLASPPETSGVRTRTRIEMASELLGFPNAIVVNLFPIATKTVVEISEMGVDQTVWHSNRGVLMNALNDANEIVLAYGLTEPSGPAKLHHRSQVEWLLKQIALFDIPVWTVGGLPRHPSRWQRYTSREHPTLPFRAALERSLHLNKVRPR